jgi:hypothetical protein
MLSYFSELRTHSARLLIETMRVRDAVFPLPKSKTHASLDVLPALLLHSTDEDSVIPGLILHSDNPHVLTSPAS